MVTGFAGAGSASHAQGTDPRFNFTTAFPPKTFGVQ
jgi:hypothetical protein